MSGTASFGAWVQQRRKALGLSRPELAARIGCAVVTIRKIEADERRPSAHIAELLARHLELPAAERPTFVRAARALLTPERLPSPTLARAVTTIALPAQRGQLIGRDHELEIIHALLCDKHTGLLTLIGPPGVGKTRLALRAAALAAPSFADGACLVALAPLSEPTLLASAIAQALGVQISSRQPARDTLVAFLRQKQLLLVLDNFEQLLASAPLVADLLTSAPQLKILATSRAALRLSAEREFAVPPLALPADLSAPADEIAHAPAIQLFIQRAQAVHPGATLAEADIPAIAAICRQLDALPLAIELAAARSKLFAPSALLARLANRLDMLTGGMRDLPERHQTLHNAIAWSYDLLERTEQALFRQLGTAVGGCTLAATAALAGAAEPPLGLLESLIDKSLLRQESGPDGEPRFTMLETLREYALERLEAHGESEAVRERHARHFLALAEAAEPELQGPEQNAWHDQLETEHDNMRAALTWCLHSSADAARAELGLRLASALWLFWQVRSHYREGTQWLERALAMALPQASAARASALNGLGMLRYAQYEYAHARELFAASLEVARAAGDQAGMGHALNNLGTVLVDLQDLDDAAAASHASLAIARTLGMRWLSGWALMNLGRVVLERGETTEAGYYFDACYTEFQAVCNTRGIAFALIYCGSIAMIQEDTERACAILGEALNLCRVLNDQHGVIYTTADLGRLIALRGDLAASETLLHESTSMAREHNDRLGLAWSLAGLAFVQCASGKYTQAHALLAEATTIATEQGDNSTLYALLNVAAASQAAYGNFAQAARLLGAGEALAETFNLRMFSIDRAGFSEAISAVRTGLTPDDLAAAWVLGRTLTATQALASVLKGNSPR